MVKKKTPKAGDVLEMSIGDCRAYLHYLGNHPEYGGAIRVLDAGVLSEAHQAPENLVAAGGYVAFYPVAASVSQGLTAVVGHTESNLGIPSKLRRPGARSRDGTVLAWIIEEGGDESLTKRLSDKEKALPIAVIWNHEMLCTRISEGWRPEQEC